MLIPFVSPRRFAWICVSFPVKRTIQRLCFVLTQPQPTGCVCNHALVWGKQTAEVFPAFVISILIDRLEAITPCNKISYFISELGLFSAHRCAQMCVTCVCCSNFGHFSFSPLSIAIEFSLQDCFLHTSKISPLFCTNWVLLLSQNITKNVTASHFYSLWPNSRRCTRLVFWKKIYFKILYKPYPAFSLNSGSLATKIFWLDGIFENKWSSMSSVIFYKNLNFLLFSVFSSFSQI